MKKYTNLLILAFLFLPVTASAYGLQDVIRDVGEMILMLTILAMGVATLVFFWGLVKFIINTGSGSEAEQAKGIMFWGIIALFVMFSVWGLVRLLQSTFQLNNSSQAPGVPDLLYEIER